MEYDLVLASTVTELSEDKEYLTLNNRVFFFNAPNLNRVQLNYDESSLEKCKSLINMPLLAKYIKRDGKDDLGGHEVSFVDGEMQFGTQAIGVITDVQIIEEEVETCDGQFKTLPCLYATERVWKRYKNVANAVQRLYAEGSLYNSWELKNNEYTFKDGIKYISNYTFLGNCLLGTQSFPAYGHGGAKVLNISEMSDQYEFLAAEAFSEALALDVESMSASNIHNQLDNSESGRKEMTPNMEANENIVVENAEVVAEEDATETVEQEVVEEVAEENTEVVVDNEQAEVSDDDPASDNSEAEQSEVESDNTEAEAEETSESMTEEDIRRAIEKAVRKLEDDDGDDYHYVSMIFPEEHIVLVRSWKMKSLQYIKYTYKIDGDEVALDGKEKVELTISPLNINSEIESKNNAIADANSRIVELENQNAELIKAKEELDKIKAEQAEAEKVEAVNKLREYVVRSGRFTDDEIASEEMQKAINELNESWIKAEIADRLVASMSSAKDKPEAEVSEKKDTENVVSILLSEEDKKSATSEDVMRAFFNRV